MDRPAVSTKAEGGGRAEVPVGLCLPCSHLLFGIRGTLCTVPGTRPLGPHEATMRFMVPPSLLGDRCCFLAGAYSLYISSDFLS